MKLRNCPFCGSSNLGISDKSVTINYKRKRHVAVYCKNCNCYGSRIVGDEEGHNHATDLSICQAKYVWNNRIN